MIGDAHIPAPPRTLYLATTVVHSGAQRCTAVYGGVQRWTGQVYGVRGWFGVVPQAPRLTQLPPETIRGTRGASPARQRPRRPLQPRTRHRT